MQENWHMWQGLEARRAEHISENVHAHSHTHTHVCVCGCVCVRLGGSGGRGSVWQILDPYKVNAQANKEFISLYARDRKAVWKTAEESD